MSQARSSWWPRATSLQLIFAAVERIEALCALLLWKLLCSARNLARATASLLASSSMIRSARSACFRRCPSRQAAEWPSALALQVLALAFISRRFASRCARASRSTISLVAQFSLLSWCSWWTRRVRASRAERGREMGQSVFVEREVCAASVESPPPRQSSSRAAAALPCSSRRSPSSHRTWARSCCTCSREPMVMSGFPAAMPPRRLAAATMSPASTAWRSSAALAVGMPSRCATAAPPSCSNLLASARAPSGMSLRGVHMTSPLVGRRRADILAIDMLLVEVIVIAIARTGRRVSAAQGVQGSA
mmetsp:Transcript_77894/g.204544  ORF Transcript_77894/g.204544 Transcript_77894/m.204544 type:complete len:306 (+) Transcript_77894:247-1164(+)